MANPDNSAAIVKRYQDAFGNWREASDETCAAILAAMGQTPEEPDAPVWIVRRGERKHLSGPGEITLEDGTTLRVESELPQELPLGYHTWRYLDDERETKLIVSPGVCYLPEGLRIWGWSARELNAGLLLINPLGAASPYAQQERSPYYPSSRRFRNPLYLRIEEIPGAAELHLDLERLAAAGKALNRQQRIDRDSVFKLKNEALQIFWQRFSGDSRFDDFCREQGEPLGQFAAPRIHPQCFVSPANGRTVCAIFNGCNGCSTNN
jgi:4-alpha-glucanotransferase